MCTVFLNGTSIHVVTILGLFLQIKKNKLHRLHIPAHRLPYWYSVVRHVAIFVHQCYLYAKCDRLGSMTEMWRNPSIVRSPLWHDLFFKSDDSITSLLFCWDSETIFHMQILRHFRNLPLSVSVSAIFAEQIILVHIKDIPLV